MVYPSALPSPGGNNTTAYSRADDLSNADLNSADLSNMIDSFQSPSADHGILSRGGKRGNGKITLATPQRQPFGTLTNRRNEFTPLLKSVHRSSIKRGVIGEGVPMPEFLKPGARLPSSPALPEDTGDYSEQTGLETVNPSAQESSVGSTPMAPRGSGGEAGASLVGDRLMTLREQEQVIDDIKKENFSLRLKLFFLNERLGPEHMKEVGNERGYPSLAVRLFSVLGGVDGMRVMVECRAS